MPVEADDIPWHHSQWSLIARALNNNSLPHALLLAGPEGVGKQRFMQQLLRRLLCQQVKTVAEQIQACGQCAACRQFSESGAQADLYYLRPEEGDREIKIDAARNAISFTSLAPHYGGRKLLIIDPADRLNRNAANALLKTIEEPPEYTVLILLSSKPSVLMPTIRSRCTQLRFSKPANSEAISWLARQGIQQADAVLHEANGLPFTALRMAKEGIPLWREERDQELLRYVQDKRSASALAAHWLQLDHHELQLWLYSRLKGLLWLQAGNLTESGSGTVLKRIRQCIRLDNAALIYRQIVEFGNSDYTNINKHLSLVSILDSLTG